MHLGAIEPKQTGFLHDCRAGVSSGEVVADDVGLLLSSAQEAAGSSADAARVALTCRFRSAFCSSSGSSSGLQPGIRGSSRRSALSDSHRRFTSSSTGTPSTAAEPYGELAREDGEPQSAPGRVADMMFTRNRLPFTRTSGVCPAGAQLRPRVTDRETDPHHAGQPDAGGRVVTHRLQHRRPLGRSDY